MLRLGVSAFDCLGSHPAKGVRADLGGAFQSGIAFGGIPLLAEGFPLPLERQRLEITLRRVLRQRVPCSDCS